MNNKKIPLRKCVACSKMLPKDQLYRIVKTDNGFSFDPTGKCDGRGAYICKQASCIDAAIKKKSFNRSFKSPVDYEVINSLYLELENDR